MNINAPDVFPKVIKHNKDHSLPFQSAAVAAKEYKEVRKYFVKQTDLANCVCSFSSSEDNSPSGV